MGGPIVFKTEQQEPEKGSPELTVRDCRTGKLRRVRGVVWEASVEPPRKRLELWERDQRRGRLTKVISWQDRREGARWGERDEEELDLELLGAIWMGY